MKRTSAAVWMVSVLAGVAGCKPPPTVALPPTDGTPPAGATVFETMIRIAPASNVVWELAGKLYADDGSIDPKLLTDEEWRTLGDTARSIREAGIILAETPQLKAAPPGVKIESEGTVPGAFGAAEVQAAIDAAPEEFRAEARQLVTSIDEFIAAVAARDGTRADAASNRLTEVCASCHARFWYPNQPRE